MLKTINISSKIPVPAEQAWTAISNIGGLELWFPIISECRVTGDGVGATRILTLENGGTMTDIIELIDHQQRRLQYNRIQSPFPVQSYIGTVEVHATGQHACELSWTIDMDVAEAEAAELAEFVKQAISDGIQGLAQALTTTQPAL